MVKVSVVVPCYNQGAYLNDCVHSILNQSYTYLECIIVDDGSTDNSRSIIERLVFDNHQVKAIYQSNKGVASARNEGIKKAKAKFILPLDADDKLSSNYLSKCIEEFEAESDLSLVYGAIEKFGEINNSIQNVPYSFKKLLSQNMIHCSAVFHKKSWEAVGGYDESMILGLEDWEFWINILNNKSKVAFVGESTLYYRIKKSSRNRSFSKVDRDKIAQYISEKHRVKYLEVINNLPDFLKDYYRLKTEIVTLRKSKKNALKVLLPSLILKIILKFKSFFK
jgi:glycosyltransferase involved in cell wall biosynthesis